MPTRPLDHGKKTVAFDNIYKLQFSKYRHLNFLVKVPEDFSKPLLFCTGLIPAVLFEFG